MWALFTFPSSPRLEGNYEAQQKQASMTFETETGVTTEAFEADGVYEHARGAERISKSFAGHIGRFIEPVLKPLGFDWRIGIALISGFAAKEVFVATMGQIYALGEVQGEESLSLVESVRNDPLFTPLLAVTIMVFVLLSSPCIATIAVIKQESNSWKWPLFMIAYTNSLAWIVSFMVYQGGKLLGFA